MKDIGQKSLQGKIPLKWPVNFFLTPKPYRPLSSLFFSKGKGKGQKGIALLTVIWVLVVLMVIVFSFSFMARTETLSTLAFKEGMEKRFLAEAGVERGVMELFYRKTNLNKTLTEDQAVWRIDGSPYEGKVGEGNYLVRIFDESGKLDLNKGPERLLRALIRSLVTDETEADSIMDSILDWRDGDDLHRLLGAESDYYQSLPRPYQAKNADFETLEELLLVKGVTRGLLYGDKKRKGLTDFLTVLGKTSKININAASREVLMIIPGMTTDMVEEILTFRQKQEIMNLQEVGGTVASNQASIQPYITTAQGAAFSIESLGFKEKTKAGYAVKAIVSLSSNTQYNILYFKTPVTVRENENTREEPTNGR
jgi:general secretion pathway protein K